MRQPLQIIRDICEKKKAQHTVPCQATMHEVTTELLEEMKEELREMCRAKIIEYHETLNSVAFNEIEDTNN